MKIWLICPVCSDQLEPFCVLNEHEAKKWNERDCYVFEISSSTRVIIKNLDDIQQVVAALSTASFVG